MHYQLFFPGQSCDAKPALRAAGLDDFLTGSKGGLASLKLPQSDGTAVETRGLLVGWSGEFGAFFERQRVVDLGAGTWLVLWTDSPVTPEDLQRGSLFTGYDTKLADGQLWRVPSAAELPCDLRLRGGQWESVRKPQFQEFWRQSELWQHRYLKCELDAGQMQRDSGLDWPALVQQWVGFCLLALRQNYRLTPEIASELGLLDTSALFWITFNVLDRPVIEEIEAELGTKADRESAGFEKKEVCIPG